MCVCMCVHVCACPCVHAGVYVCASVRACVHAGVCKYAITVEPPLTDTPA